MEYKINSSNIKSGEAFALPTGKNVAGIKLEGDSFRITAFPDATKVKSLVNYNNYHFNEAPIPYGYSNHEGMDFQALKPTNLIADTDIYVKISGTTSAGSNWCAYDLPASDGIGTFEVKLHHLSAVPKVGKYAKGKVFAKTGNSGVYNGAQTPPHLHIEMRGTSSGALYDPLYEFDYKAPTGDVVNKPVENEYITFSHYYYSGWKSTPAEKFKNNVLTKEADTSKYGSGAYKLTQSANGWNAGTRFKK